MGFAVGLIIIVEFCERIGYYTFQSTQKSWLQNQGYSNAASSSLNQVFGLLSYVSCFFGGWLAETSLGRYRTIWILVSLYVCGCFVSAIATHANIESTGLYFLGAFVLIALGTGGIKPNVCTFGADQIDPALPDVDKRKESFFMYFYMTINVGCLIAFGFLASVATSGLPGVVPADEGFFAAYMISSGMMAIALLCFVGGTRWYRQESFHVNSSSVLSQFLGKLWSGRRQPMGIVAIVGWVAMPLLIIVSIIQAFVPIMELTIASLALDVLSIACLCIAHRDNRWLGEKDAVTRCLDNVPVILIGNVTFNILYNTMASVFYSESCQMDTRLGSSADAMQLNGAFFNLGDAFAIVVFTPIIDRFLMPVSERLAGRKISYNFKIIAGIGSAMLAQAIAACIEYARVSAPVSTIGSKCAPLLPNGEHVPMSEISAFWMFIPYALIGIGEVLVNPVLQHVAYDGADPSMRSLMQAFNLWAMGGFPNAVSAAMSEATASMTPNNLNDGNLPAVYCINIAVGLFGCVIFIVLMHFRPKDDTDVKDIKSGVLNELEEVPQPVLLGSHKSTGVAEDMQGKPEEVAPQAGAQ